MTSTHHADGHPVTIRQDALWRVVAIGLFILAIGAIAASDSLHAKAADVVTWSERVISGTPLLGKVVFVLLAMVSAMVAFFSSAVLVPVAIYAWGQGTCLVLLWLGWFLGGIASYAVGRFLGRTVVTTLVSKERIAHWQSRVSERSRFVHILFFQAVVPSEIPGYVLGMFRYRLVLYLAALAITELPYALVTVYLGDSFLKRESTVFIAVGVSVVLVGAFLWIGAKRHAAD